MKLLSPAQTLSNLLCIGYTPTGWAPSVASQSQYVQVGFSEYFKVGYEDFLQNFNEIQLPTF